MINPRFDRRTVSRQASGWSARVLAVLGFGLAATALLPLLPFDWWWIRIGDFPRLQLLLAYLPGLAVLMVHRHSRLARSAAALLVLGIGIQLYWIFPYLPVAAREVEAAQETDPARRIRILTANVLQSNDRVEALLDIIEHERPDVVVLCEVDARWLADLKPGTARYPYRVEEPRDNTYGISLYSRLEVISARVRTVVRRDVPSLDVRLRLRSGHEVRMFAVHPAPPRPGQDTTERDAELVLVGREVADEPSAIVLGDLNDVGWSRTTNLFQEVSGLLDPRKGRGQFATFNARSAVWRYPLDYVFHSDDFRVAELRRLRDIGSDHFPLLVELSHEPAASATQSAPTLDPDDVEDAQDAVEAVAPVGAPRRAP